MGLAASALGNHELDEGLAEVLRLQGGGCHPDPFGNELITVTLTGAELEQALEDQFTSTQGLLQVSGLSYTWSMSAPDGARVDPASVLVGGGALDLGADYRVTVNSFLIGVGRWAAGREPQYGLVDVAALTAWFRTQSPIAPPTGARISTVP